MWMHWSRLCYCQNKPANDPRGPYGRPGARGHHVGDPCSMLYLEVISLYIGLFSTCFPFPTERTVSWASAADAGRLGSIPDRDIPKTWKTILAACPASFSASISGCKRAVHVRCCATDSPPVRHSLQKQPHPARTNKTYKSLFVNALGSEVHIFGLPNEVNLFNTQSLY